MRTGDLSEYMLSEIASVGQNDQFCASRHIIQLMAARTAPIPKDALPRGEGSSLLNKLRNYKRILSRNRHKG